VDRTKFTKSTYDRALESLDLVNGEIEANIRRALGEAIMARNVLNPAPKDLGTTSPLHPIQ
jgi:hypothetical protein